MTHVRRAKADIIWRHFGLKKGKSDCYRGGGHCVQTVRRYNCISYKTQLIFSKCKYKHFETCGIPWCVSWYMGVYRGTVSKGGTQP